MDYIWDSLAKKFEIRFYLFVLLRVKEYLRPLEKEKAWSTVFIEKILIFG